MFAEFLCDFYELGGNLGFLNFAGWFDVSTPYVIDYYFIPLSVA